MGRKILKAVAGVFVVIIILLGIFAIYLGIKVFSIHRERKQVSEAYRIQNFLPKTKKNYCCQRYL